MPYKPILSNVIHQAPYCKLTGQIILTIIFLAYGSLCAAQEPIKPATHDWVKIDGPQIDHGSWVTLSGMVSSPIPSIRDNALDTIEEAIKNGATGPSDPNVIDLLSTVCLTPLQTISAPGTTNQPDLPLTRIRAIQLTSQLGGDNAHEMLIQLLSVEHEPTVLAEAHEGLRRLMHQPDENEIHLIIGHLLGSYPNGPHNSLVIELLNDIKAYHIRWNVMARPDVFDAIMKISENTRFLQRVRTQAQELIKILLGLL